MRDTVEHQRDGDLANFAARLTNRGQGNAQQTRIFHIVEANDTYFLRDAHPKLIECAHEVCGRAVIGADETIGLQLGERGSNCVAIVRTADVNAGIAIFTAIVPKGIAKARDAGIHSRSRKGCR